MEPLGNKGIDYLFYERLEPQVLHVSANARAFFWLFKDPYAMFHLVKSLQDHVDVAGTIWTVQELLSLMGLYLRRLALWKG